MRTALAALFCLASLAQAADKQDEDPGGLSAMSARFWTEYTFMERDIAELRSLREGVDSQPLEPILARYSGLTQEFHARSERAAEVRRRHRLLARALQGAMLAPERMTRSRGDLAEDPAYAALLAEESQVDRMRTITAEISQRFADENTAFRAALAARRAARARNRWTAAAAAVVAAAFAAAWLKLR
ncbi:MAG: hypothetical protein HYZ75_10980 [Elusimicrobia bacterium]|nr:hypothetical protein [Elusimicrobiota bacterium]